MRYNIDAFTIRSENAAKPPSQASSYVTTLLSELAPFTHALDYGCGKLRYAHHLYHLTTRLTVVDSAEQLDRKQLVLGESTTVREYVADYWLASRALDVEAFRQDTAKYGFILCSNVLSSIPDCNDRVAILRDLSSRLTKTGQLLVISQYTNSYFCNRMRDPTTTKYNDGFILGTQSNASFYGLIPPKRLLSYVDDAGLCTIQSWRRDQSAYVIANRAGHIAKR